MVQPTPPSTGNDGVDPGVKDVLPADPDVVFYDPSSLPIEFTADLVLQEIGGVELMILTRSGSVSGKFVSDRIISNLSSINFEFSPLALAGGRNNVRSSRYALSLSDFEDDTVESVVVEGDFVVVTLKDVPYGYVAEISVEVATEEVVLDPSLW